MHICVTPLVSKADNVKVAEAVLVNASPALIVTEPVGGVLSEALASANEQNKIAKRKKIAKNGCLCFILKPPEGSEYGYCAPLVKKNSGRDGMTNFAGLISFCIVIEYILFIRCQ